MSQESLEVLDTGALRATLRLYAARAGLRYRDRRTEDDGLSALLAREEGDGEVYFAVGPAGATYLSISLVLVVDEAFFTDHSARILEVTSRYEVCVTLTRDEELAEGEVYLNLSLRIFRDGLTERVFGLAVANLGAAKDALAEEFP
jgi:hypothetical protein